MKGFVNEEQSFWSYSKEEAELGLGSWSFLVNLGSVYTTRVGLLTSGHPLCPALCPEDMG